MSRSDFVHLHVHSDYSLLDSTCSLPKLLERAKSMGMGALALTDHGNLFGAVEFYEKAVHYAIKPILGCELYVSAGALDDAEARRWGRRDFHLTVLVRNDKGYRNLLQLASHAHLRGKVGPHARVDRGLLEAHGAGLVALTGCFSGEVQQALHHGDAKAAQETAAWMEGVFGRENLYLEIMDHGTEEQRKVNQRLLELSRSTGLPLVATNDVHYLSCGDARAHDALTCIGQGRLLAEVERRRYPTETFHFRSPEEMGELFRELPHALKATREVADRCNLELPLGQWHLPAFQTGKPVPNSQYLKDLCVEGLMERYGKATPVLQERLDYELSVIERMGFTNYFLIVWDFIRFARERGVPVGPGRGSASSSLVAYCLKITAVDPMRYELVFERFLEPSRITQPDIDIDFCQQRREEVLAYVRQKYGERNVAQIITFGTMAARAVLRDVGRVLDIPLHEIDVLAKKIPAGPDQTLAKAIQADPELQAAFSADPRTQDLLEISQKLEGLCRHASTHAAGVVIADRELSAYVPLYQGDRGVLTQYSMEVLERIGLLKMDFLGLETLTLLSRCVELVRAKDGTAVDLGALPLDDPDAYAVLGRGETVGVFQCESSGMRELMTRLKPGRIEEVIAAIALYRPGPLQAGMVEAFIRRKNGQEPVEMFHPDLAPVLKDTYGVIVYQEQVMQIANRLAGFTMSQADSLRKAMGKKNPEVMAQQRESFIAGSLKRKVPQAVAERIFDLIAFFGGYGFNKAHSTAYAIICYQTAYLKAKHPTEFMAAGLTSVMGKTEKVVTYLDECRRMGIEVLPPSLNESGLSFAVAGPRRIRFGLGAVRNVGDKAVEAILAARASGGPFTSLLDFCERVDLRLVNAGVVDQLIKAGAFDVLGARRAQLVAVLERTLEIAQSSQHDRRKGQSTLFGGFEEGGKKKEGEALPDVPEFPEGQRLAFEKESLGFYVSSHPLARHAEALRRFASVQTGGLEGIQDGQEVVLGGIVTKLKRTTAKKGKLEGERMAILTVEDLQGTCEGVLFPSVYASSGHLVAPDRIVFLQGRIDKRREEPSLKVNVVIPVEQAYEVFTSALVLVPPPGSDESWLLGLRTLLREHPGECPVYLEFPGRSAAERTVLVGNDLFVTPSQKLLEGLAERLGGRDRIRISVRRKLPEAPRAPTGAKAKSQIPF